MVGEMSPPGLTYKVFRRSELATLIAHGVFDGSEDDLRDGYIHLSTADQVAETLMRHFRDKPMLFLGFCASSRLGDALRMETSRGGALFPHLYRPLLMADLVAIVPIPDEREGWRPPSLTTST